MGGVRPDDKETGRMDGAGGVLGGGRGEGEERSGLRLPIDAKAP